MLPFALVPFSQIRTGGVVIFEPSEGHTVEGHLPVESDIRKPEIAERRSVVKTHTKTHLFFMNMSTDFHNKATFLNTL